MRFLRNGINARRTYQVKRDFEITKMNFNRNNTVFAGAIVILTQWRILLKGAFLLQVTLQERLDQKRMKFTGQNEISLLPH